MIAGCGGDAGSGGDHAAQGELDIPAVIEQAKADGTAKTTGTIEVEGMGLAKPFQTELKGTTSLDEVAADLSFEGAPMFERMGVPAEGPVRLVLVNDQVAVSVPQPLDAEIPEGKQWIGLDLGKAMGTGEAGIEAIFRSDIESSLAPFEAGAPLKHVGEEEINGVDTTHWRGEASLDEYLATLPEAEEKKARESLMSGPDGSTESDMAKREPVDFWIDDDHHLRRMLATSTLEKTKSTPAGKLSLQFDYDEYSQPDIALPDKAATWDATDTLTEEMAKQPS
ncbi:MAG: hypothetical protein JHC95_06485 [Solirubrobacteraceae bacterium]|nr:hypothetical protein [Solirubrobacteraceae bacterium]